MTIKEFKYYGKTLEELQKMDLKELAKIMPSRQRRKLNRGLSKQEQILLDKIRKKKKNLKTHSRSIIILPEMVGHNIKVHNGKEFVNVTITQEMIGRYLGEFVLTRKKVEHSAPGIGATKSSAAMSVK